MFSWRTLDIKRFYGLDKKTNVVDVKNSDSIDCENVYQNKRGVISKRNGNAVMFAEDSTANNVRIDAVGSCTLNGTKYYFKFYGGKFAYSKTLSGTTGSLPDGDVITPSPAIATGVDIWFTVLDDKLFFVDGTNVLRYFDGTSIKESSIYPRPTTVLTTAGGGSGFDYTYTIDNGLGESPACLPLLNVGSGVSVTLAPLTNNPTGYNILAGYKIRVYSRSTAVTQYKLVAGPYTVLSADVTANTITLSTAAINDTQPNLYSDLGAALNKSAPTGLKGLITHYGRLVGWKDDYVYNSKSSNPHSWPDNAAVGESFVYGFGLGDGDDITSCVSFLENLVVLKQTKIAIFAGIGPDDTGGNAYSLRRLETNGIGCISPKSAVVIGEEQGTVLVFLSRDGFYATTGSRPNRVGENIEVEIQGISDSILSKSHAFNYKKEGFYLCFVGTDTNKTMWLFDYKKDQGNLVGWFKFTGLHATCSFWDDNKYLTGRADGVCLYERNTSSSSDFSDAFIEYVSSVDAGNDTITVTKDYTTGETVIIRTTGTLPGNLSANVVYYAIRVNATTIKLATSQANALANNPIDISSSGSGTHTLVSRKAINSFYTTNWIKFENPALVKKLAKPFIVLNASATSVNLKISTAYDWVPTFTDEQSIVITSSHAWGQDTWGSFIWGSGSVSQPKNIAIAQRKCRSIRYKFVNNELNQDFDLQGLIQNFAYIRNRGNFAE